MPSRSDFLSLAPELTNLAAQAGRLILELADGEIDLRTKADASPVTAADVQAEDMILEALGRILPGVPILAEESAARGAVPPVGTDFVTIDPLDGTREFIAGRPEYTVNIGLIADGRPVLGVLHAPALGKTYWGAPGHGAFRATHKKGALPHPDGFEPIHTRLAVSSPVALTSRGHNDEATECFLDNLGAQERQRLGSAYKFALVAEGSADIYARFVGTMEWDTAAGEALLAAAGGAVLTPEGQPLAYGKTGAAYVNGPFIAWGRPPA